MKHYQRFFTLMIAFALSYSPFFSFSQICNPTESWLPTSYPGTNARQIAEMNGNLYTVNFHVPRQEYVLFKFDGFQWTEMSAIPVGGVNYALAAYKGQIYLGGTFTPSSTQIPNTEGIIRWDSTTNTWSDVGGGTDGYLFAMEVYQGDLYIGGNFQTVGGNIAARSIAKWDGNSWDTLKNQSLVDPDNYIQSFEIWNNKLIVGGKFVMIGDSNIVQYDTTSGWTGFGISPDREVEEMAVYNGDLIAYGAWIDFFGGQFMTQIARWDGTAWQPMGMGPGDFVGLRDMIEYDGDLWVTGSNSNYMIGGLAFDGMARWDGTQWHLVTGFIGHGYDMVNYQDRLYLAGNFTSSCNDPMDHFSKLCSVNECQTVSGNVFQDDNGNCTFDTGEFPMNQQWVNIGNYATLTDMNGDFSLLVDTGAYTVDITSLPTNYTASCPVNGYNVTLGNATNGANNLNFGLTPTPNVEDLSVSITTFFFRPGFDTRIYLDYKNEGTVAQNPQVDLTHDLLLSYNGMASPAISSQAANVLTWLPGAVNPTQGGGMWAEVNTPVSANLGDTVCNSVLITPMANDGTPANNSDTAKSIITGSYDPNDKQVSPAGEGENGEIPLNTKKLTYKIRFQNTGTDTAFTVVIRDEIDEDLDLTTLTTLGASHGWSFEVEEDRRVKWTFENILLPDSNINEPASHGYVSYTIELKENLPVDTRIENTAGIYFDFNPPIITNTTVNTLVVDNTRIDKLAEHSELKIWPQPAINFVNFESEKPIFKGQIHLFDLQGRKISMTTGLSGTRFRIPVMEIPKGVYVFRLIDENGATASGKLIID